MSVHNNLPKLNIANTPEYNSFVTPMQSTSPSFSPLSWFSANISNCLNFFGLSCEGMPSINWNFNVNLDTTSLWNISAPSFQLETPTFNSFDTFTRTSSPAQLKTPSSKYSTGVLQGYNPTLGKKLAQIALHNANYRVNKNTKQLTNERKPQGQFSGLCATYVKMAIRDAGAGSYQYGDAHRTTDILKNNPNFRQISPNSVNVNELPAGCVLVYNKGAANYSSECGHTEITDGKRRGISDGITNDLRKPSAIFIPV